LTSDDKGHLDVYGEPAGPCTRLK